MTIGARGGPLRWLALGLLAVGAVAGSSCSYNKFTAQEEAIKAQWSQVENQLQRRNDLIPNLVATVKGYAQQEQTVFKDIADARAKLAGAQTTEDKISAANAQTSALSRLLVISENYPQLKSDAQFMHLQDELAGTENRLATERMRYNDRVREYDTARRQFPGNLTAKMFGFKEYPYFEAPAEVKAVPKVDFSTGGGSD
jgi:LemA protein